MGRICSLRRGRDERLSPPEFSSVYIYVPPKDHMVMSGASLPIVEFVSSFEKQLLEVGRSMRSSYSTAENGKNRHSYDPPVYMTPYTPVVQVNKHQIHWPRVKAQGSHRRGAIIEDLEVFSNNRYIYTTYSPATQTRSSSPLPVSLAAPNDLRRLPPCRDS